MVMSKYDGGLGHDHPGGDLRLAALGNQVLQHDLGQRQVDLLPVEAGEGGDPDQRALQLADVGLDPAGDELQHLRSGHQPLLRGLLPQDRDPGLQVRRLYVGDQPPAEPAAQPRFQVLQQLRRAIGGHHDLLLRVVQRVEGVEELFLGLFLALQELDVVDQQHVDVAIAPPELGTLVLADRVDEVVGQFLGGDVADPNPVEVVADVVAEGVQQVGLAQAGLAVDGQRVVRLARILGHRDRGGVGEPVRAADDEGLEGVLGVEPGVVASRCGRLYSRPLSSKGRPRCTDDVVASGPAIRTS